MPNPFKALRRKSAGNVMDDENLTNSPPSSSSSFRVLERKDVPRRSDTKSSFNVIQVTRKSMSLDCVTSSPDGYRTSYGSSAVNSSRTQSNDASSFSARYSSSSTLPSPPEHAAFVAPEDDLFKSHEISKPRVIPEYPTHRPTLSSTLTDLDLGDDFDSDLFSGANRRQSRAGDIKLPSRPPGAMARSQENLFGYNRRASPAPTSPPPDGSNGFAKAQQASNTTSLAPSSSTSLKTPSVSSAASSMPAADALSTLSTPRAQPGTRASGDTTTSAEGSPIFDEATTFLAQHVANQDSDGFLLPTASRSPPLRGAAPATTQSSAGMKRLTAAEFAQMKQMEEPNYDTDSEESDQEDEDIDETEHLNRIKDQRRRQEESVARHRQQAMKVTGDRSSTMFGRPGLPQNSFSSPSLSLGLGNLKLGGDADGNSGSSSDDDVPLGMLPMKKEANGRTSRAASIAGFRPASHPAPRPGTSQGITGASGSSTKLPAFARNLPLDPYNPGQNVVQPSNRESMAFQSTGAPSVYGMPTGMPSINAPPQGTTLVGQIETEERQRAMRRGSPNAQIGFGLPSNLLAQPQMQPHQRMMSFGGNMNFPGMMGGMPPPMSGGAETLQQSQQRIAMLQQILNNQTQIYAQLMQQELLQSQQQYPQHMSQMGAPQDPRQSQYLGPPQAQMRPMSIAPAAARNNYARTMSMVNVAPPPPQHWSNPLPMPNMGGGLGAPSMRNFGGNQGYAPSLAPSERSNIGTATRYRPVQNSLADGASTGASTTTVQPGTADYHGKNGSIMARVKAIGSKKRGQQMHADTGDSDDEDSWGQFKAGRGR